MQVGKNKKWSSGVVCPGHAFHDERQCNEGLKSLRVSVTGRSWALMVVTDDARLRAASLEAKEDVSRAHGLRLRATGISPQNEV